MTHEELVEALEAELRTGYPDPPPEAAETKRARLLRLDREMRRGGRVGGCDWTEAT